MKKKILVVDRDKDILEIITYILTDRGYEVVSSPTEDGILKQILEFNPDAILLDIIRPEYRRNRIVPRYLRLLLLPSTFP
ncbi:MAG TPA: hypothetical protein VNI52_01920 [Sphingobacteriaceae bacterium]|nr:hypothetical protein [Sphingobacteriaceae bacterium]